MDAEDLPRQHFQPMKRKTTFFVLVVTLFWADDSSCLVPAISSQYVAGTRKNIESSHVLLQFVPQNELSETEVTSISLQEPEVESSWESSDNGRRRFPEVAVVETLNNLEARTKPRDIDRDTGFVVDRYIRQEQRGGDSSLFEASSSLEALTRELVDSNHSNNTPGSWTIEDFDRLQNLMNAWSRQSEASSTRRPAVQQEQLLRRVIEEKLAGNPLALKLKMGNMYNAIVNSWSKSFETGAPERAEEILDAMQHAYNSGEDVELKPTINTWNHVLSAHALSNTKDAPRKTMRVLSKLYQLHADGKTDVKPNQESYASILKAHANQGGSPKRILKILRRMQELSIEGYSSMKPDTRCHNVYLKALVDSMDNDQDSRHKGALLAESYLRNMTEDPDPLARPDRWSFSNVLSALSKSGEKDIATKAETLIAEMDENCATTSPNTSTYNCLIACYASSNVIDKVSRSLAVLEKMKTEGLTNPACRPDCITYNSIMSCIVKTNDKDAPYKVEALLDEMNEIYEATGNDSVKPTIRSYNSCLDAWARSECREAPKRILGWIKLLEHQFKSGKIDVPTNTFTYNCYLQAISKQRRPFIADEAEQILHAMEMRSPLLKPDVMTYTNVLHCFALSESDDALPRGIAILSKMEDGDVRPNSYTYNALVNVVAKSKVPGKAKIALRMLGRMKEVSIRPGTITYNNVLNACAYSDRATEDRKDILDIALMVLREAQDTVGANYVTYSSFIRVIRFFVDDRLERWQFIRNAFRQCCTDGQLTPNIMKQIKPGVTLHQYDLLMKEATDVRTGRWRDEYMTGATRLISKSSSGTSSLQYT